MMLHAINDQPCPKAPRSVVWCVVLSACQSREIQSQTLLLQVMDFLGSAAFSKAVQALDTKTGMLVCLKIIKVRLHFTKAQLYAEEHMRSRPL